MRTFTAVCTLIAWALFPRLFTPKKNEGVAAELDELRRRRIAAGCYIEPVLRKPETFVVSGASEAEIAERLVSLT